MHTLLGIWTNFNLHTNQGNLFRYVSSDIFFHVYLLNMLDAYALLYAKSIIKTSWQWNLATKMSHPLWTGILYLGLCEFLFFFFFFFQQTHFANIRAWQSLQHHVRPALTRISMCIIAVGLVFAVHLMKLWVLSYHSERRFSCAGWPEFSLGEYVSL